MSECVADLRHKAVALVSRHANAFSDAVAIAGLAELVTASSALKDTGVLSCNTGVAFTCGHHGDEGGEDPCEKNCLHYGLIGGKADLPR